MKNLLHVFFILIASGELDIDCSEQIGIGSSRKPVVTRCIRPDPPKPEIANMKLKLEKRKHSMIGVNIEDLINICKSCN